MFLTVYLPLFLAAYLSVKFFVSIARKLRNARQCDGDGEELIEKEKPVSCGAVLPVLLIAALVPPAFLGSNSVKELFDVIFSCVAILLCAGVGAFSTDDKSSYFRKVLGVVFLAAFLAASRFDLKHNEIELLYSCPLQGTFFFNLGRVGGAIFLIAWSCAFTLLFDLFDANAEPNGKTQKGVYGFGALYALLYVASLAAVVHFWSEFNLNAYFANCAFITLLCGFLLLGLRSPQARLGNAGRLAVGFTLSVLSMNVFSHATFLRPAPLVALFALPAIDGVFAILRKTALRKNANVSELGGMATRLENRFGSKFAALCALALLQAPLTASVVFAYYSGFDLVPLAVGCLYWLLLPATGLFGREEMIMALRKSSDDAR